MIEATHCGLLLKPKLIRLMERRFGEASQYSVTDLGRKAICRNERGDRIEVDTTSWRLRVTSERKGHRP